MNDFNSFKTKYGLKLNAQQEQVVNHINGPAVVLAVAGAGKTTSIVSRIGNLIFNYGIAPETILTMTFSKASAKDMKNRFNELFGNDIGSNNVEFSTIHSFTYRILYIYSKRTGRSFSLIEDEKDKNKENDTLNKYRILRQIAFKYLNEYITEDQLEELINNIGYVKNMMIKETDFINHDITFTSFKEIYLEYEQFKSQNNLIDYDDMLTISYEILLNNPKLLDYLRNKYSYIQVDEAQDTSPIQFEIIKLLAYPKNNIVFVGDDDQSIYRFRGTKPEIMLNFPKQFNNTKSYFMEQNFRSTENIINLANSFIKQNEKRYKKTIFTEKSELVNPEVIYSEDEVKQIEFIIDKLKSTSVNDSTAILFRNNQSAIYLMDQLNKNGFNFYIKDFKNKFFKHWIIQDILNFINVAIDPSDINSFFNIYYKTNSYLSKEILTYAKNNSYPQKNIFNIMLSYPNLTDLQKINIIKVKSNFNALKISDGERFIKIIENQLGYENYLKRHSKNNSNSLGNFKNILGTFKLITVDVENIREVKTKLNELELLLKRSSYNKDANITLSTVHSAKGLEFDNVYVVDIVEDIFPNYSSIKKAKDEKSFDELEEERRLMYVAITRAKEKLFFLSLLYKNSNMANKSLFVKEIEGILNINDSSKLKTIYENAKIDHKKFGIGKIKSIDKHIATIVFPTGEKIIDLDICTQNNLIKRLN
ncbi:ATP-dependent helicase [Serpentinicella alkaliphila]|uniref:DNA 3'-5' helicase n=1 Tax=Serpentinicella alkaliphila TaxID=1734049 RepID=A0A4R2T8M4_9FIRM|nr:ATP-dependent helicase [Serpentinicella alkaliphila]QUH24783.1 ATP-dependent helicase [Serpentinicella alkaliphila]TCP98990.1 DNA helicase-2/ATP-dependent DNA helicase PcrA [Serpentinicella alkaliphila]